jgi:hypothetical protein
VLKLLLSIQENDAKKFKWNEGSKQYDKIVGTRDRLKKLQIKFGNSPKHKI